MPLIDRFRYRPEIDGLRALAVSVVVFYHAGLRCPGGYIGVDVFFVISGFLITSLIWKDLETGCFTFAHFWERRARRIAPALIAVTLATLIAGWFWLIPPDYANLGKASAAQAVFGANIHYYLESGYFEGAADEKPLLHTWSLAVEEQFYLIVPFIFWGLYRYPKLRSRSVILVMLAAGIVLSLGASIYGVAHYPSGTFYLLPTRAWELLLGSLVAFAPISPAVERHRLTREMMAIVGCALILFPAFLYTRETPFPGLAALPPCLGTALLIWVNSRASGSAPTGIGTLLSMRHVVFVGLISYSLYLWHWPVLAFSRYVSLTPLPGTRRVLLVAIGFSLAVLSWKFVETPFRVRKLGASTRAIFAYAGGGLALMFGSGILCIVTQGFPQRLPSQAREYVTQLSENPFLTGLSLEEARSGKFVPIGNLDPNLHPSVLVWGDSHAAFALPALDEFLKERGLAGRAATHASTAPILDWFPTSTIGMRPDFALSKDTVAYNDAVFAYIQKEQIPDVVLVARWHWEPYIEYDKDRIASFDSLLCATIRRLVAAGVQTWVLLDVPIHTFDVPKGVLRSFLSHEDISWRLPKPIPATTVGSSDENRDDPSFVAELEAAGARVLDPKPRFIDPENDYYRVVANGTLLYCDKHHLTGPGAKLMVLPLLRESLVLKKQ